MSRRRYVVEQAERELTEIKPILPQVNLVAIMGGGYPSSEAMFPFGSEFNFDCGKVTASPIVHLYPPLCGTCPCDIYIASVAWAPPWNVEALRSKPLTSCLRKLGLSSSDLRCLDLGLLDIQERKSGFSFQHFVWMIIRY